MYIWLHMAIYTHICTILAQEVHKTSSQRIHTQEASVRYTKLDTATVQCHPTSMSEGCSANPATLTYA